MKPVVLFSIQLTRKPPSPSETTFGSSVGPLNGNRTGVTTRSASTFGAAAGFGCGCFVATTGRGSSEHDIIASAAKRNEMQFGATRDIIQSLLENEKAPRLSRGFESIDVIGITLLSFPSRQLPAPRRRRLPQLPAQLPPSPA